MEPGLQIDIQIYGLKEALKELNKAAPVMRRQITKDAKKAFSPLIKEAGSALPSGPPLRGMNAKWRQGAFGPRAGRQGRQLLPTNWAKIATGTVKIDTRNARRRNRMSGAEYESLSVFALAWTDRMAQILEFTGTGKKPYKGRYLAQSDNFVEQIAKKAGVAPGKAKYVWHYVDGHQSFQDNLEKEMEKVIADAVEIINRELGKNIQKGI